MDWRTFDAYDTFWTGAPTVFEMDFHVFSGCIFGFLSLITLIMAIFVKKLQIHPVVTHVLLLNSVVFLFNVTFTIISYSFMRMHSGLDKYVVVALFFMRTLERPRMIWASSYMSYLTVYLCIQQLVFLIGSSRLSKLFRGGFLYVSLSMLVYPCMGTKHLMRHDTDCCSYFPIVEAPEKQNTTIKYASGLKSDPQKQIIQLYAVNTFTLILVLITFLITKTRETMARSSQVYAESQGDDQQNGKKNSFWVFVWFVSLFTLKLLAALNITFGTVNLHPTLSAFSYFILCETQIPSQTAILLAAWFSGLSNSQ